MSCGMSCVMHDEGTSHTHLMSCVMYLHHAWSCVTWLIPSKKTPPLKFQRVVSGMTHDEGTSYLNQSRHTSIRHVKCVSVCVNLQFGGRGLLWGCRNELCHAWWRHVTHTFDELCHVPSSCMSCVMHDEGTSYLNQSRHTSIRHVKCVCVCVCVSLNKSRHTSIRHVKSRV